MDYKELIEKLRNKDGCNCECLQAADAIETLLAERDAAVEDLRGYCRVCTHANIGKDGFPCVKCKHIEFYGTQEIDGWGWRGPQKGENHPTPTAPAWAEHLKSRFLKMD